MPVRAKREQALAHVGSRSLLRGSISEHTAASLGPPTITGSYTYLTLSSLCPALLLVFTHREKFSRESKSARRTEISSEPQMEEKEQHFSVPLITATMTVHMCSNKNNHKPT